MCKHSSDSETSEFGVGMKAGALTAANQLNVYSKIIGVDGTYKYIEVICDFIRMSNEPDVNASYNPRIRVITYAEYAEIHPFDTGSTIKLSKIRDVIYPKTTQTKITEDICVELSTTYSRYISKGVCITVNSIIVEPMHDYFTDPKCIPFGIQCDIFVLEHNGMDRQYIARHIISKYYVSSTNIKDMINNSVSWYKYDTKNNKWISIKNDNTVNELLQNGYSSVYTPINSDNVCLKLRTIFTFYSDK